MQNLKEIDKSNRISESINEENLVAKWSNKRNYFKNKQMKNRRDLRKLQKSEKRRTKIINAWSKMLCAQQ